MWEKVRSEVHASAKAHSTAPENAWATTRSSGSKSSSSRRVSFNDDVNDNTPSAGGGASVRKTWWEAIDALMGPPVPQAQSAECPQSSWFEKQRMLRRSKKAEERSLSKAGSQELLGETTAASTGRSSSMSSSSSKSSSSKKSDDPDFADSEKEEPERLLSLHTVAMTKALMAEKKNHFVQGASFAPCSSSDDLEWSSDESVGVTANSAEKACHDESVSAGASKASTSNDEASSSDISSKAASRKKAVWRRQPSAEELHSRQSGDLRPNHSARHKFHRLWLKFGDLASQLLIENQDLRFQLDQRDKKIAALLDKRETKAQSQAEDLSSSLEVHSANKDAIGKDLQAKLEQYSDHPALEVPSSFQESSTMEAEAQPQSEPEELGSPNKSDDADSDGNKEYGIDFDAPIIAGTSSRNSNSSYGKTPTFDLDRGSDDDDENDKDRRRSLDDMYDFKLPTNGEEEGSDSEDEELKAILSSLPLGQAMKISHRMRGYLSEIELLQGVIHDYEEMMMEGTNSARLQSVADQLKVKNRKSTHELRKSVADRKSMLQFSGGGRKSLAGSGAKVRRSAQPKRKAATINLGSSEPSANLSSAAANLEIGRGSDKTVVNGPTSSFESFLNQLGEASEQCNGAAREGPVVKRQTVNGVISRASKGPKVRFSQEEDVISEPGNGAIPQGSV